MTFQNARYPAVLPASRTVQSSFHRSVSGDKGRLCSLAVNIHFALKKNGLAARQTPCMVRFIHAVPSEVGVDAISVAPNLVLLPFDIASAARTLQGNPLKSHLLA